MSARFPVAALFTWVLAASLYFFQYALRSAPSVMMPQLRDAFGVDALGVAAIVGMFYYGYSPFNLVAGAAIDRLGAKRTIPVGAALVGAGALLFGTGHVGMAILGRFLQGAGGAFALVGAIYLAIRNFPPSHAAAFIGATQMFGMAGGSAGQFFVGPLITGGLPWGSFWTYAGFAGLAICVSLVVLLPNQARTVETRPGGFASAVGPLKTVFSHPQSILCGLIAGLLFIPTTIFDMTWGVRYIQEARGREYDEAVRIAATVPLGWMIGCPLLGFISDRIGRRKPVILGGALALLAVFAWVLYGVPEIFRGPAVGILMGIASGAAMLPTTVIKELHSAELSGSATGVVTFINFTFSALLSPVFGHWLVKVSGGSDAMLLEHYQLAFKPMIAGIVVAAILTCLLKETGPAAQRIDQSAR
ncbi:MAG: MFS transporter [Candidatus Binatia bacterium]